MAHSCSAAVRRESQSSIGVALALLVRSMSGMCSPQCRAGQAVDGGNISNTIFRLVALILSVGRLESKDAHTLRIG